MGNRRFSRKRLFEVEKRGQAVDLESGATALDGQRLVLQDGEWMIEGESGS